ncbi:MAG: hypothetical protein R2682_00550 [Pyrinomonadaceae bacterium]
MPKRTRQNSIRLGLLIGALLLTFGCGREYSSVAVSKAPSSLSELPAPTPQQTERRTGLQWERRSGSFGFSWNGKDLEISTDTQKFGLFNAAFEQRVQSERRLNDLKDCHLAGYFRPLAVAGTLVSFDLEFSTLCGGRVENTWAYRTVEITKDKRGGLSFREVRLTDLFSDADLLAAFLRAPQVEEAVSHLIAEQRIRQAPTTFKELENLMAKFPKDFLGGRYYLAGSLDSFAVRKGEADELTLWISLMPVAPPEAALRDHLEIRLPPPAKYRDAIKAADAGISGFLMSNADSAVGDESAIFETRGQELEAR